MTSNDILPLNIIINIVFVIIYQRVYINNCWYDEDYEEVQIRNAR